MKIRLFDREDVLQCTNLIKRALSKKDSIKARTGLLWSVNTNVKKEVRYHARWVLIEKEKIVGICGLYSRRTWSKKYIAIGWFAIEPPLQHKGYGIKCMEYMLKEARKSNYPYLAVWSDKHAISFYKKLGFKKSKAKLMPREGGMLLVRRT